MSIAISDILGYTSISCWLGAQFPQVVENARRRSVEGLAWPFLLNWLLGDISNLVGCLLTHQLPFQTYLAIYFCFVDVSLVAQYIYYRQPSKSIPSYPARSRAASFTVATHRLSTERPATHYRALSSVAANVAAAAALAAQQEEQTRWQTHRHSVDSHRSHTYDDDDEVDDEALARLADSFHSERGTRKKVSWSRERGSRGDSLGRTSRLTTLSPVDTRRSNTTPYVTSPVIGGSHDLDFATRGRPRDRLPTEGEEGAQGEWEESTAQRRSSRASRKGASMIFLGVWALFGVGTLMNNRRGLASSGVRVGKVLTEKSLQVPPAAVVDKPPPVLASEIIFGGASTTAPTPAPSFAPLEYTDGIPSFKTEEEPTSEYIVGRISAWICTTLYLTSRLPQIWKNYVRKSVDGLSMSLFIFAFLGNFFYVSSILTSPKLQLPEEQASAFIRESIPYLLGSGGTLMFDVTIVSQSFLYRQKPVGRGRRSSRAADEEEGLLSAGATGAEDNTTPSRRRFPTANEGSE